MNWYVIVSIFILLGCARHRDTNKSTPEEKILTPSQMPDVSNAAEEKPPTYANARFRNVAVMKMSKDTYKITGEGQIFEASFNWVVEDGHNELKSGYTTTDAGAPAWGNFTFSITVAKMRENSVLHLILFELNAKDGRRTHDLPILLK